MKEAIITAMRICIRYCRNAVSEPTSTCPASARCPPNHSTAASAACISTIRIGPMSTKMRPMRTATSVRASLAAANRRVSCSSRTKARMTRRPMICSRSTALTSSVRSCMTVNSGISCRISRAMMMTTTGAEAHTSQDRPASSRTAMMMPPTTISGRLTMKLSISRNSIWICWTSLVPRVIRVGAPKEETSSAPKPSTAS